MDTKYVAAFLMVAVMIMRIQCGAGEDCTAFTQCMKDTGIVFQSVLNSTDIGIVRSFFDILCSNIDALVTCYIPNNLMNCNSLKGIFQYQSTAGNVRDQFTNACAQREGFFELYECLNKDGVAESITQCPTMLTTPRNTQEIRTTQFCSRLSEVLKCVEMTDKCSAKALSFLESATQKRLNMTCSAPKMVVNVLLLCMLYMLNRVLLF